MPTSVVAAQTVLWADKQSKLGNIQFVHFLTCYGAMIAVIHSIKGPVTPPQKWPEGYKIHATRCWGGDIYLGGRGRKLAVQTKNAIESLLKVARIWTWCVFIYNYPGLILMYNLSMPFLWIFLAASAALYVTMLICLSVVITNFMEVLCCCKCVYVVTIVVVKIIRTLCCYILIV